MLSENQTNKRIKELHFELEESKIRTLETDNSPLDAKISEFNAQDLIE